MNDATIVYRQIHPSFVQAGFPTSQAFRPTPKDESKLSVYDGDLMTPENAFQHYVNQLCLDRDEFADSVVIDGQRGLENTHTWQRLVIAYRFWRSRVRDDDDR